LRLAPAARFSSGEAVREALEELAASDRPARRDPDRVPRHRRARAAAALALVGLAATAALATQIDSAVRPPEAPTSILLARPKPGDGSGRMPPSADGWTAVRDDSDRTSLWLEDLRTGESLPLPLPPGRISRRIDALPGASRGAEVVLVRMQDLSLWRTGRGLRAAELVRARGNGAACVHPSGERAVVSR